MAPFSGAGFACVAAALPDELCRRMVGASWHPDPRCPPFAALRLLTLRHWDFAGAVQTGQLIVGAVVAAELEAIFAGLYALGFPIARMEPIDVFGGNDDASMAANNTSCFNFRNVAGTETLSKHAFGVAIDINPLHNPMIIGDAIHPPAGAAYTDRAVLRPGMIVRPGPVVDLFDAHGWEWGGDWAPMKDYHHFTKPPRG
jgi:poly-gamma-glutamate synthesis protein (capsule biosynthesis protein)